MAADAHGYEISYDAVIAEAAENWHEHMCWPVEWFKQDIPLDCDLQDLVESSIEYSSRVPGLLQNYTKDAIQEEVTLGQPEKTPKWSVLVFSDHVGYCNGIFKQVPGSRVSHTKFVQDWYTMTQDDVKKVVKEQKKGWDLIVFAAGVDPPSSNSVPDVIEQNALVSRLYLWLVQAVQSAGNCPRIFTLTRGEFPEDKKTHKKAGLGITVGGTLFGMSNTAREELEDSCIQFCDTEYFLKDDDAETELLFKRIAAEAFRATSFGQSSCRVLYDGRYVVRYVKSEPYEEANQEFLIPNSGIIAISGGNGALGLVMGNWLLDKAVEQGAGGFEIQFLSRSMKITEQNEPMWKEIQEKAVKLRVRVQQGKLDMSSQEGMDKYLHSCEGRLAGFIHSAGVLEDCMLQNMTWEKCETVFASKHWAALYLHDGLERISNPGLSFLWLFSSVAVYGGPGQINYSGSNAFLDCLTRHRRAKGMVSMAVQWGPWGEVGMAATLPLPLRKRMDAGLVPTFTNAQGLDGLERGLKTGVPYFTVCRFHPDPKVMGALVNTIETPTQGYRRNFYGDFVTPPLVPNLQPERLYAALCMQQNPGCNLPAEHRKIYNTYVVPAIANNEREWGEDFREW